VTWTATAGGHGATPVYQFSVGPFGGVAHVVRDFSTSSSFTWDPMREGTYDVRVTIKDDFSAPGGESADASYTATSRVSGTSAVVSPTSNPLVALYSAPPAAASAMYVQFSPDVPDPSWRSTAAQPVVPGQSTNFLVAGLLPNTTYLMRHVLSGGSASDPLTFTTGSLPANLPFPEFTVKQAPAPGNDATQDMIYHVGIPSGLGSVALLATDLGGSVDWYYDAAAHGFAGYGVSLVPGGTVLMLGGNVVLGPGYYDTVREIDLAGDALRETNVAAVNAQLAAMGQHPIICFDHDAQRLPNGDTAVIASAQRTVTLNGTPTLYTGNMVLVLDQDFHVTWVWDAFSWLDTTRLGTVGEGPSDWTHANSVAWSPADGNLVVSLRSQDWVVKIAYGDGTGDGHVVWRLGRGGDFAINSPDPFPWFTHQHDARYVNDNTLVVFDDGNTRLLLTGPAVDSRGQELVLDEQTRQAALVVNADLGDYSPALGSAQVLPNGNLAFTSGFEGSFPDVSGRSIEVSPGGTTTYALQMSGTEYRSYFMSTLYAGVNAESPSITSASAATFTVGVAGSFTITTSPGLAGGLTLSEAGPLPAGLSFTDDHNGTATLAGTATAGGLFTVTITAANGVAPDASQTFQLTVDPPVIALTPALAPAQVGVAYHQGIAAAGGTAPYHGFVVTSGALPAGLTLDAGSGQLSGTPTAGGTFHFTVRATDSSTGTGPFAGSQAYALAVAAPALALSPSLLRPAQVGLAFSQAVSAGGGTGPYRYSVSAGSLPPGVALNTSTGALSGTPRAPGAYRFAVRVTDSSTGTGPYSTSRSFTLSVAPGAVARLVFLSQPGNAPLNGLLRPFWVAALDRYGNLVSGAVIRLALVPLSPGGSAAPAPGSVVQATAVGGVATFSRVAVSASGRYALLAVVGAVGAFSDPFSVAFGGPGRGRSL
jgi:hypothetical protein